MSCAILVGCNRLSSLKHKGIKNDVKKIRCILISDNPFRLNLPQAQTHLTKDLFISGSGREVLSLGFIARGVTSDEHRMGRDHTGESVHRRVGHRQTSNE